MADDAARVLDRYLPDSSGEPPDLTYTLDLTAVLFDRLEQETGPFDGLLVFKDRDFAGEGPAYIAAGTERLISSILTRRGSGLHCYVEGDGVLGRACERMGGRRFAWPESPLAVVETVLADSRSALTLEVSTERLEAAGALEVSVLADTGIRLRAPHAIWRHPQGKPAPSHFAMVEGLTWIRRALEAEQAGNMTNMLMSADAAARQDPWNPEAHAAAGRALQETADWAAARERFSLAIDLGARDEATLQAWAAVSRRSGRAAQALRRLQPLLASGGASGASLGLERARLLAAAGMKEAAAAAYGDLLRERGSDDTVLAEYGAVLRVPGGDSDAAEMNLRALTLNPRNLRALCFFAEEAARRGERESAEEYARKASAIAPADPQVHAMHGALAEARGDWTLAASHYSDALRREPADTDIEDRLTGALVRAGRVDEATRILRHRVDEVPEDAQSWYRLGEFLIRTGSLAEAASVYEAGAAALRTEGAPLYLRAAELRERLDESGQALLDYRATLRTSSPDAGVRLRGLSSAHIAVLELMSAGADEPNRAAPSLAPPRPAAADAAVPENPDAGVEIPGGLDAFARVVGIGSATLRQSDALEQTLFFVIGAPQQAGGQREQYGIAREIIAYLRNHDALLKYLVREHLLPKDFNRDREQTLAFPLVGPADSLRRTAKFLAFFGVSFHLRKDRGGGLTVELVLGQGSAKMARQQFLRTLGVNLNDPSARECRVIIGSARIPLMGGVRLWNETLLAGSARPKSPYFLERLLGDPRAIRLYLALSKCSAATREGLTANIPQGGLLPHADALFRFGFSLEFRDRKLVLPGKVAAWSAVLGLPSPDDTRAVLQSLCRNDAGRPLALYAALSSAPRAVRDFVAVPGRLEKLYQSVLTSSPASAASANHVAPFSIGRALRSLHADTRGLLVEAPEAVRRYYGWPPFSDTGAGRRLGLIDEPGLTRLLQVETRANERTPPLALLEFFRYLSLWTPESLSPKTLEAFARDPIRTRAMLDLVLDVSPPADLLGRYLDYCSSLASENLPAWNVNRVRSSQALFHLLGLLRRQDAVSTDEARRLLASALECLTSRQESDFAQALAGFLSNDLLPVLRRSRPGIRDRDLILAALAGRSVPQEVRFEGRSLRLDAAGWKLQRMKATIQHQDFLPLDSLLEAYGLLQQAARPDSPAAAELLAKASELVRKGLASASAGGVPGEEASRSGLGRVLQRAPATSAGPLQKPAASIASEMAAALHVELGVSLLAFSYAFHGAPEVDVLAFDGRFVRKHEFAPKDRIWLHASRTSSGPAGLRCVGSIAGLAPELGGLETSQVNQDFGSREGRELLPSMLSGMRAVEPLLRTDRAQEFVAVAVRLGREVLAAAATEEDIRSWVEGFIGETVPPRRRQEVLRLVGAGRPVAAAGMLSPSELFLLGDRFRVSTDTGTPQPAPGDGATGGPGAPLQHRSPHLDRLRQLLPPADDEAQRHFWREVGQYGMSLRSRLGLSRLSIAISDSFESLEGEIPDRLLYERICDLKIRLAELNYALGLPAALGEVQSELALRDILPKGNPVRADAWRSVLERISRLGNENVRDWLEELVNRGALAPAAQTDALGGEAAR